MASNDNQLKPSTNDDDIPLQNMAYAYEEDEYGYVDTKGKKISKAIISQLPSRHFDVLDTDSQLGESDRTLRRRQSHYRTLQLKNATLTSRQVSADVDKIYELLNSDPDANEEEKIKTLREMHQSLTIKRQVKEKLDADMKRRRAHQVLDKLTRFKLRMHTMWHKFGYELKNTIYSLEPWHSAIKAIQGQFGSGVASYFIFLRWLLYLNVSNFFFILFFLLTPQLAYENSGEYNATHIDEPFSGYDLMTGSGWFTDSSLYFGHYSNEVIQLISGLYYNLPLAYLFTIGTISIINLIAVSYSLTSSYQKNYIDVAGDIKHQFCNKVFSAWDYSIETEDAAKLRKIAFCNEIKELLSFIRREQRERTLTEKLVQSALMVIINLFYLAAAAGISCGIYFLLEKKAYQVDVRILGDMTLALTVTFVSSASYFFLKYFKNLEFYFTKKRKLYLTMIRAVLLRTAMLAIIVYFWMIGKTPANQSQAENPVEPQLSSISIIKTGNVTKNQCYETELGKEIYRLIVVNFIVAVIFFTFFGEFIRKLISSYIFSTIKLSQFDAAYNTLDLIYYQTLVWIGTFCMPLAPLMNIVLLVLLFYLKLYSVSSNCRPSKRTWSVNEAQTFFLTLLFCMYLLTAFAVGYVIFALKPSACGPFKDYKSATDLIHNIFFEEGGEHEASEFVKYISSPGVMFAFFCALCVVLYYMRAQAQAHISVVKIIREQLIMEGKDKVFLLKLFDEALTMHSQITANGKDVKNKDAPPNGDSSQSTNQDVFNEGYIEYYDQPTVESPLPKKLEPGYIPANVPINKQAFSVEGCTYNSPRADIKFRSPVSSVGDSDSPIRKPKGIHIPSHQPGFRHFRREDSPRTTTGVKDFYRRNSQE